MKNIFIYVDDTRKMPKDKIPKFCQEYYQTWGYKETIKLLAAEINKNSKIIIDLDHDLGGNKTGYDIAKWIVASGYEHVEYVIHSANPVGAKNIDSILKHYGYKKFL